MEQQEVIHQLHNNNNSNTIRGKGEEELPELEKPPVNYRSTLFYYLYRYAFKKLEKPVTLASGVTSDYYFDTRSIVLSSQVNRIIQLIYYKEIIIPELYHNYDSKKKIAIGGLESGAIPIVTTIIGSYYDMDAQLNGFFVRKNRKDHGLKKLIEGNVTKHDWIYLVDDVITTGDSIDKCLDALYEELYNEVYLGQNNIKTVMPLIDRSEELGYDPADSWFADYGIEYRPLFKSLEFIEQNNKKNKK